MRLLCATAYRHDVRRPLVHALLPETQQGDNPYLDVLMHHLLVFIGQRQLMIGQFAMNHGLQLQSLAAAV